MAGDDSIAGGAGDDVPRGEQDDDRLQGGMGNDLLLGGIGVDTLEGGTGRDTIDGGGQVGDTLTYANSLAGVTVTVATGATTQGFGGAAAGDRISGIDDLIGSAFGDKLSDRVKATLADGANANSFWGGDGA